ncbi:MAG: hypothetical protein WC872_01255 [Candidatus Absconditabacterales bacterium]|jgi:hypothetical protein
MEEKKIVFIYNDLASIKDNYIFVAEYYNIGTKHFFYPEDFEEWIKKENNVENIKLIILGHYFPGNGHPNIKHGYFRGLEFYNTIRENAMFENIKIIIPCTMLKKENDYEKKLKEMNISLKEGDKFIDIYFFGAIYDTQIEILK